MIFLARIAERGPITAAVLAAGLLLAALWISAIIMVSGGFPLLVMLIGLLSMLLLVASAAVVAYVALRHGEWSALRVTAVCLLLQLLVSVALFGSALQIPAVALLFWLPAIVAAMVLARTVRLDIAVIAIVVCGLLAVSGFMAIVGDVTQLLEAHFESALNERMAASDLPEVLNAEQLDALVENLSRTIPGAFGISVMGIALAAVFMARAWQAALVNPGGFQKEFHALSFGRTVGLAAVLVIFLSSLLGGQWAVAVSIVVLFGLFLQGLAVAHAIVKQRKMHRNWLVGLYILVFLLPHTFLLLAALGLVDNLFSLRSSTHSNSA